MKKFIEWWKNPERITQGSRFGMGISVAIAVMAAISMFRGLMERMESLALASAVMLSLALVSPRLLSLPAWAIESGFQLSLKAVLYSLLVMIFILVFAPAGIMLRLLGKDPMDQKLDPAAESYWSERRPTDPKRIERQF